MTPGRKENAKVAQGDATVRRLLATARIQFSEKPYAAVSTEEIVRQSGVTRGALYHHFGGKSQLFLSVFEAVQAEIAERVIQAAAGKRGLWPDFVAGCRAFLETCLDPRIQRIVFIEAPSVMGWERWREVDASNSMVALKEGLAELMGAGIVIPQPVDALAHLLSGAMNEAALWIARSAEPAKALEEGMSALEGLMSGVKAS